MDVVVFEPMYDGHFYEYLAHIIPAIKHLGVNVIAVLSKRGVESEEFQIHLSRISNLFSIHECRDVLRSSLVMQMMAATKELVRIVNEIRADHVFVPGADGISQLLALRGILGLGSLRGVDSEAIHLRGAYGYRLDERSRRLKSYFDGQLVTRAPWSVYYHLDPWQLAELRRRFPGFEARSALMPDPIVAPLTTDKRQARNRLGLPPDTVIIGCAGPISHRKGCDLLVHAFADIVGQIPSNAQLLLAGNFEASIRALVHSQYNSLVRSGRLIIMDRHLTAEEMDLVIPAMDVVTTPYRDHIGSSGILLRAAACGRPVLAANRHWMSHVVPTFGLGFTCNVRNHDEFSSAIIRALNTYSSFRQGKLAGRYLKFQSEANFRATLTSRLRKRLRLADDECLVDWNWVVGAGDLT